MITLPNEAWAVLAGMELPPAEVVIAVSGGADSVALLLSLVESQQLERIIVAHVNHGLRGAESDADEEFVRRLTAQLAANGAPVTFKVEHCPVPTSAGNVEAAARDDRYRWLTRVAETYGIPAVATGHTADDQAETVLFRLLRGTGIEGLCGVLRERQLSRNVTLVRPLLRVSRDKVLEYLAARGQAFREDSSNTDPRFTRNRIRHELLPMLEREFNPRVRDVLSRLADQAAELKDDLANEAAALLEQVEKPRAGDTVILDAWEIHMMSDHRRRALWRCLWEREGWPRAEMGYREWTRLAKLSIGYYRALDFPGGIHVRNTGFVIQAGYSRRATETHG